MTTVGAGLERDRLVDALQASYASCRSLVQSLLGLWELNAQLQLGCERMRGGSKCVSIIIAHGLHLRLGCCRCAACSLGCGRFRFWSTLSAPGISQVPTKQVRVVFEQQRQSGARRLTYCGQQGLLNHCRKHGRSVVQNQTRRLGNPWLYSY